MSTTIEQLGAAGVVPVVVVDGRDQARLVATALIDGALPVAEVTLRTPGAATAIRVMRAEFPGLLVGAGTVLTAAQVDDAVAAGAQFVVSPGTSAAVVTRCQETGVPVVPGVATASDIMAALDLGVTTVKLFPASVAGGPAGLAALAAPFGHVRFIPTGGITATTLPDYLALPAVHAVGGSWMVGPTLVASGNVAEMTARTAAAVTIVKEVRS